MRREEGRSDEACAVKSRLLEKLSCFPLLNFSWKARAEGWREQSYFFGNIFTSTRDEPSWEGAIYPYVKEAEVETGAPQYSFDAQRDSLLVIVL